MTCRSFLVLASWVSVTIDELIYSVGLVCTLSQMWTSLTLSVSVLCDVICHRFILSWTCTSYHFAIEFDKNITFEVSIYCTCFSCFLAAGLTVGYTVCIIFLISKLLQVLKLVPIVFVLFSTCGLLRVPPFVKLSVTYFWLVLCHRYLTTRFATYFSHVFCHRCHLRGHYFCYSHHFLISGGVYWTCVRFSNEGLTKEIWSLQ